MSLNELLKYDPSDMVEAFNFDQLLRLEEQLEEKMAESTGSIRNKLATALTCVQAAIAAISNDDAYEWESR